MAEGLSLIINADVQGAAQGLSLLERQVQSFGSGVKKIIPQSEQAFKKFASSINTLPTALSKLPASSGPATQSLIDLSRVAQDAPYGFIGIANNINPLLESFQRLKASTGSTGGALKSLGSSLVGPAGIGLAVGVVSSLLVVFGDKLFGADKAASALAESNKKLAESVVGDLAKLTTLVGLITNVNTSRENQAKALEYMNNEYSKYLPNLDREKITAENISTAYDKITDSLIRQAVVKGLQEQIGKEVEKSAIKIIALQRAEEEKRISQEKATNATKKQLTANDAAAKGLQRYNNTVRDGYLAQQKNIQAGTAALGLVNNYDAALAKVKKELNDTLSPLLKLTSEFGDLGLTLSKPIKATVEKVDVEKVKDLSFASDFDFLGARIAKIKIPKPKFSEFIKGNGVSNENISGEVKVLANGLGETFSETFTNAAQDGLAGFGQGIGNILSGEDFGSSIIDAISGLLGALGKALISYGIAKKGIDSILSSAGIVIPGTVAIGLGVAAIAASQLLKNFGGGRAAGGPVGSGTAYVVGERGPEIFVPNVSGSIIPNNSIGSFTGAPSNSGGRQRQIVRGQNIILAYARTTRSNNRTR